MSLSASLTSSLCPLVSPSHSSKPFVVGTVICKNPYRLVAMLPFWPLWWHEITPKRKRWFWILDVDPSLSSPLMTKPAGCAKNPMRSLTSLYQPWTMPASIKWLFQESQRSKTFSSLCCSWLTFALPTEPFAPWPPETCLLVLMIRQGHSLLRGLQFCTEQGRTSVENLAPPKGPRITAWQNVCGLVILTESKGLEEQENVRTMCAM